MKTYNRGMRTLTLIALLWAAIIIVHSQPLSAAETITDDNVEQHVASAQTAAIRPTR